MPIPGDHAMNFRTLSKERKNRLVLVLLLTLIAVVGLYLGLIQRQNDNLTQLFQKKAAAAKKLQLVLDTIHQADRIKGELNDARAALTTAESDVASGDLYAWVINALRQFKAGYHVDIPQFSQLSQPTDVTLLPNFPYKQATLTVAGTAYFHNLGRFVADFENHFPHIRLLNLSIDANAPSLTADPEILSFKMDIITLVKTNPS
jgi:hypothetical protein